MSFAAHPVMVRQAPDREPEPITFEPPKYRPTITPNVKPGTPLDWTFAVNVGPGLPLQPGWLYEWRVGINGESQEGWSLPFTTAPAPLANVA
ncbi:MAG TPA: hypothetical protein VLF14_06650 [Candidatus Binatia bacterium]|nr:hypothetical protein [Candidatus Binatia bacterium]